MTQCCEGAPCRRKKACPACERARKFEQAHMEGLPTTTQTGEEEEDAPPRFAGRRVAFALSLLLVVTPGCAHLSQAITQCASQATTLGASLRNSPTTNTIESYVAIWGLSTAACAVARLVQALTSKRKAGPNGVAAYPDDKRLPALLHWQKLHGVGGEL